MDWYAIQILTGKETEVLSALLAYKRDTITPQLPVFIKRGEKLSLEYRPLMPGYVIAKLEITDFYIYKRGQRAEKMMIRLCGNEYEAVPLESEELCFVSLFYEKVPPVALKLLPDGQYEAIDHPPWMQNIHVRWYDPNKFKAKMSFSTDGSVRERLFSIAAFNPSYLGKYHQQLQDLLGNCKGRAGVMEDQVITS
jgi:hypothetical protein